MSETRRIMTVKQREPLRVPQHWNAEDRAFVIQLNGQLDEIYAKIGKLEQRVKVLEESESE